MPYQRFKELVKHHFHEVMHSKTTPHAVAMGFAVGTLISILPTPGFNILLGVIAMLIWSKLNKFALFGAMVFWNPITSFPLYVLSYRIGDNIFGSVPAVKYDIVILDQIYHYTLTFLVGISIVALATAVISYPIVYYLTPIVQRAYHKRRTQIRQNMQDNFKQV